MSRDGPPTGRPSVTGPEARAATGGPTQKEQAQRHNELTHRRPTRAHAGQRTEGITSRPCAARERKAPKRSREKPFTTLQTREAVLGRHASLSPYDKPRTLQARSQEQEKRSHRPLHRPNLGLTNARKHQPAAPRGEKRRRASRNQTKTERRKRKREAKPHHLLADPALASDVLFNEKLDDPRATPKRSVENWNRWRDRFRREAQSVSKSKIHRTASTLLDNGP